MRSTKFSAAALALFAVVLGIVASALPPVAEVEEAWGLGWLFTARGPVEPPREVAVVAISGESAQALGVSRDVDEWPRELHAELIDRLQNAGASVIAFDIIFEFPREEVRDGDARLAAAIASAGNVVLAERVTEIAQHGLIGERRVRPIEDFRAGALATAPFILPLFPARVGQSWTFGRADGTPSLPATVLHAFGLPLHGRLVTLLIEARPRLAGELGAIGPDAIERDGLQEVMRRVRTLFLGDPLLGQELDRRLAQAGATPEDRLLRAMVALYAGENGRFLNFYGQAGTIDTIPYHEVLAAEPTTLSQKVGGRAVFVGFSEHRRSEQRDYFDSVFSERSGQRLSGVEIGATAFANLLNRASVAPIPFAGRWLIVAVWGALVAAISVRFRGFWAAGAVFAAAGIYAVGAQLVFETREVWPPMVVPLAVQLPVVLIAGLAWSHTVIRRQRERIQEALGYYVPASVVKRLAAETSSPHAHREIVYGTCLVTDAEQYTTLSESLPPAELGDLMDAYYEVLVEAVDKHGGIVSDIGGDSMVAVWPTAASPEAARAAASRGAIEVLAAVERFNRERVRRELPTRIGLDAGQLLLGNVGASGRGEFRAVGDIVNTAARLQSLNRLLGTRILVSSSASAEVAGLRYRRLGNFLLVGKRTPVAVLELRATPEEERSASIELDEAFDEALEVFLRGDLESAERAFSAITARFPEDGPARFYAAECKALIVEGRVRGPWDGVVRVTTK